MIDLSRIFISLLTLFFLFPAFSAWAENQVVEPYGLERELPLHLDEPTLEEDEEQKKRQEEAAERLLRLKQDEKALFSDQLPPLSDNKDERLDVLFKVLQTSKNSIQAERAIAEIQRLWHRSGSDTIDLMLTWSNKAIEQKNYAKALDYLDNIIRLDPDFAEGWNKRASVYFLQREFSKSIADLERTLSLEPRHFSALSGLGVMLQEMGDEKTALSIYKKAFDLNPTMRELEEIIQRLEKKVKGRES